MVVGQSSRVCEGCLVVEKSYIRFFGPTTYFAISMPSCGCCDCDTYDNAIMVRGVGVLCQKLEGRRADIRVCGRVAVVGKSYCRFTGPTTYFATSMPSCGCCDCDTYHNASMVGGVGVLCQK